MRLPRATLIAALCTAAAFPATAGAQSSDPKGGSPPGSVYELPVEGGRKDAAPLGGTKNSQRSGSRESGRRGGSRGSRGGLGSPGASGDGSGGGTRGGPGGGVSSGASGGAPGFGARGSGGELSAEGGTLSSESDGAPGGSSGSRGGGSAGDATASGGSASGSGAVGDSPLRSENDFGSSSRVPGLDEVTPPATRNLDRAAAGGGLGTGGTVTLVVLGVLAAIAIGVGARRAARGN